MVVSTDNRHYTVKEYLQLEETATERHEYRNGKIITMVGGTANHNKIALNFCRLFPLTIKDKTYDIYINDMRLAIPAYNVYTYPDIIVVEGASLFESSKQNTLTNPLLIIEVLSKSTKSYDCNDKFKFYRSLPSLQEYIVIDQYSPYVEQYHKQNSGGWLFNDYVALESILTLLCVDYQIPLANLYARINFEVAQAD